MRLVNIFFALYTIFLVCYPCTDDAQHDGVMSMEQISQNNDSGEEDPCSPFCVCQCCSAQLQQPSYFTFHAFCPTYLPRHEQLKVVFIPTVPNSIWQPPKRS